MKEEKVLPNGTEVFIFKYIREWGLNQDDANYIKGRIQNSQLTEDLSYHGTEWRKVFYTVLGEDGKNYFGTYGHGSIGGSFFRTPADHIKALKNKKNQNKEKIQLLEEANEEIENQIADILLQEMEKKNPDFESLGIRRKK